MKNKKVIKILPLAIAVALTAAACGGNAQVSNEGAAADTTQESAGMATDVSENNPDEASDTEAAADTDAAAEADAAAETDEASVLMERSFPVTEEYVKLTGRTAENNGIRWIIHSASKVSFRMTGTKASVTIKGDGSSIGNDKASQARFAVYVNGERTMDHMVGKAEETLEIFSAEEETEAEIEIIKLSEAAQSIFGISGISVTASKDIEPLPEKETKIEFIGDSITCGYGVDDEDKSHHFSTETEDATKTYAYKTAQALDADYSFVSYSGHGIISGYSGDGNKVESQLVPAVYECIGKNYGSANGLVDLSAPWDFSSFEPDYVVINLGTNDDSYTKSDVEKQEDYTASYVDFLKTVRKDNPNAHIIASLGIMGDRLFKCVEDAVGRYTDETGDTNISTLKFKVQDGSTGYAADWHPTEVTHEIAAKALTEHILGL